MRFTDAYLEAAHKHTINNREEIQSGTVCGCFYCLQTCSPFEIVHWIEDTHGTAQCPGCSIDSVMGEASGYPVTDPEFLGAMHESWFKRTVALEHTKPSPANDRPIALLKRLFSKTH